MSRRRFVFFSPVATSAASGSTTGSTGGVEQVLQLNIGDGTYNTPDVSNWERWCANESDTHYGPLDNSGGTSTGWYITRTTIGGGAGEGYTGGTSGYPDNVEQYANRATAQATYTLSGLTDSNTYDLEFLGSTTRTWENVLGTTEWTVGTTTVTIQHRDYAGDVVSISDISPSSGEIDMVVDKGNGASNWYWSALRVTEKSS